MAPARSASVATNSPTPFHRSPVFAVSLLAVAALLAYSNSFSGAFVFDDEPSIVSNPTIRSLGQAWWPPSTHAGITVEGRPLLNFSLGINYAISGTNVWSYHVLNLLIHFGAGALLFGVVRRTLLGPKCAAWHESAFTLALTTAAIWTLHPLQTESVTYIIQRAESLAALFYLSTLWFFIRAIGSVTPRKWLGLSFVACVLGMMTKEVMVTAPLIVILYDRTFAAGSWAETWRKRGFFHVALIASALIPLTLALATGGRGGTAGFATAVSSSAYALTQIKAVAHYLRLTLWPAPLILDYGTNLVSGWKDIVLPALVVLPLGIASLWKAWRGTAVGFCGMFFFVVLAPSSSVLPIATQTMAEHRMYLPLAAVIVLVAVSLQRLLGNKGIWILLAVTPVLAAVTIRRNQDYATPIRIYEDTVAKCPTNARAMALLADYYRRAGRGSDARQQLENSLRLDPNVPDVWNNLGFVLQDAGETSAAVNRFQQALRLRPGDISTINNLGNALVLSGQTDEGIAQLETAARLAPTSTATRSNLANALARSGRMEQAAVQFEALLKLQPEDLETHGGYSAVLSALGRTPEAIAQLEIMVRLQPENADLHNRLGTALGRAGRVREALEQFQAALRLDPGHVSARQNAERARRLLESH